MVAARDLLNLRRLQTWITTLALRATGRRSRWEEQGQAMLEKSARISHHSMPTGVNQWARIIFSKHIITEGARLESTLLEMGF